MRTFEGDILFVPGLSNSGPEHWQSRWQQNLSTARRVEQDDWERPDRHGWTRRIVEAVEACRRPVVFVAHSLGVAALAHAVPRLPKDSVRGAFLVAPPDVGREDLPGAMRAFASLPGEPLPFPSLLVASRSDPYCAFECAEDLADAWGSAIVDAGHSGHLDAASGHGPWPEGLMRFAGFLRKL